MSNVRRNALTLLSLSIVSLGGLIRSWRSLFAVPHTVLYHEARGDRSGATLHHMLLAHAYAYQNNFTYGGACFTDPGGGFYVPDHEALIETLGLRNVLKFACPKRSKEKMVWAEESTYYSIGSRLFTNEWMEYIRSLQSPFVTAAPSSSNPRPQMVVYMRRGDVDLCSSWWAYRYLPNSYYQTLIEEFREDDMEVSVYSESQSTEAWNKNDDFGSLIDHWHLDAPIVDTWKAIMTADVLILSCSSFSFVPALFNWHGRIIYTPFWEQPLPHWYVVDDATIQRMEETRAELATELCPNPN